MSNSRRAGVIWTLALGGASNELIKGAQRFVAAGSLWLGLPKQQGISCRTYLGRPYPLRKSDLNQSRFLMSISKFPAPALALTECSKTGDSPFLYIERVAETATT